jgi:hypothetical protein
MHVGLCGRPFRRRWIGEHDHGIFDPHFCVHEPAGLILKSAQHDGAERALQKFNRCTSSIDDQVR